MVSLSLQNISVDYVVRGTHSDRLFDAIRPFAARPFKVGGALQDSNGQVGVSALSDISINLKEGDRLALIGNNGAGKTTLLKVMAGILPPTQGRVRIEGHVSSLLSIQLGLKPMSTGFENILTRARYMGHSDAAIKRRYDDIAEFSELGDYLSLPIRTYSSGMRLRLAFAIATAFKSDIVILDEWLSAGDVEFRQKAAQRLTGLIEQSSIVVFASHNPMMHRRICNQGMFLDHGKVLYVGDVKEAYRRKREIMTARRKEKAKKKQEEKQKELAALAEQEKSASPIKQKTPA